jgi:LmbE family N-acetylglucosaminyl deacetylase/CheY-like chemotaxis protein
MSQIRRVLVVDDDEDLRNLLSYLLVNRGGYDAIAVGSAEEALKRIESEDWDVVLTDIHMPGASGLDLSEEVQRRRPALPILLMTSQPSVDLAVTAVRQHLSDFLVKPLDPETVLKAVARALTARAAGTRRVLAIGAHPDDVEIGAGATLADHVRRGDEIRILTMSRGRIGGDAATRAGEAAEAARLLGAELSLGDLEDTNIPAQGPTVTMIEAAVEAFEPDTVYVHSLHDVHQDHRSVHQAAMVACRQVSQVFCYQSPSSTIDFRPSRFVSVEPMLDRKLRAIAAYGSQVTIRSYLDEDLLRSTARYWGRFGRCRYAEPFEVVRDSQEAPRARD